MNTTFSFKTAIFVGVLAIAAFAFLNPVPAEAAACLKADVSFSWTGGASANVRNNGGAACEVYLASYEINCPSGTCANNVGWPWISSQTMYDQASQSINPGQTKPISVNTPDCENQVDLVVTEPISPPNYSSGYFLGVRFGGPSGVWCNAPTPPAISADIKANGSDGPVTITSGAAATLTWTSQNATNCTVTPGNFTGTSGTQTTGQLFASRTYTVTCTKAGQSASDSVIVNVTTQAAPTVDIKANGSDGPVTIPYNTAATITWTSQNAVSCTISPTGWMGIIGSQSSGALTSSQTYTATCLGTNGQYVNDSVSVLVAANQVPTVDIKANGSDGPITVAPGSQVTLSWTSQNATNCTASGAWSGTKPLSGSEFAQISVQSVIYTITCTGPGGSATDSVVVNTTQNQQVTADIKANGSDGPVTIPYNTAATITWTSQNATSCTVTPGGFMGTSGTQTTGPLTNSFYVYTVSCTGPGGAASDTVTVNVEQQQQITADIKANGQDGSVTIPYNTTALISWTSQGATNCFVSPNGWTGTSGAQTSAPLTGSQVYSLTCYSTTGGSATDSVTVNVNQQNLPPTVTINANPSYINQGQTSILTWQSQNATSCYASGGWSGTKALSGSESVSPFYTTTYTIICTNSSGQSATAQTTVTVQNNQQQPTVTLYANPTSISQGQSSVLTWNSQNTTSCYASGGWSGTKSLNGSEVVYPSITTTYTISCTGTNGSQVQATATVYVNQQNQQPTVTLYANPTSINQGQSSILTWYSSNANTCTVSGGWSGTRNLSGSETVYPSYTTSYTITCSNNYGVASDSETIFVGGVNPGNGNVTVTKLVRNITLGQNTFSTNVEAQGLDTLEFEIRVRNSDNATVSSVVVRDILPQELFYVSGSTTVGGTVAADGITQGGLTLYNLNAFEERIIRFRAVVFYGTAVGRVVTNQATATGTNGSAQNGFATVTIRNRGQVLGVGDIITGPENPVPWVLFAGFLGSLAFHFFVVRRGKFSFAAPAESAPVSPIFVPIYGAAKASAEAPVRPTYTRANALAEELEARLAEIRAKESHPDTEGPFSGASLV